MVKLIKRSTRKIKKVGGGATCSTLSEEDQDSKDSNIVRAIKDPNPNDVECFLENGANPNVMVLDEHMHLPQNVRPQPQRVPAIIYAARHIKESSEIMKHLINKGASVELNNIGTTPLIEAAEYGNQVAVEYLLGLGVDINATTGNGVPAIAYAVLNEDIDMIKFMLEKPKDKIDFNYTVFGTDHENVIDDAENKEVAKILKEYALEPKLSEIRKRQHDRLNLGRFCRFFHKKRLLPLDIKRLMEGDMDCNKRWNSTNSYLGGKRKTKHRRKPRKKNSRKKKHTRKRKYK